MLENAHQIVYTSAGAWGPGSAMKYRQLSPHSTKNGLAIIYANDCSL